MLLTDTAPPAASTLPSLRPEMRKRVAQGDFRPLSNCWRTVASLSVSLFLPKRPRGAYFVVLSNAGCKVGRRIRQRGFLLGWYDLTFLSPRISAGSVPMLGLNVCLARCFARPVPPGQIVGPQKRIQDGQMSGVRNLSRRRFGQATSNSHV